MANTIEEGSVAQNTDDVRHAGHPSTESIRTYLTPFPLSTLSTA
jgi:hypothetical protein